jgi:hypothetical protein
MMDQLVRAALAAIFCAALLGCSAPGPGTPDPARGPASNGCFSSSFITDYDTAGKGTIRVRAGVNDRYDIVFSGGRCGQLDWSQRLAIETPATSQLCVGKQLGQGDIIFRDFATRDRVVCHIDEIRRAPQKAAR